MFNRRLVAAALAPLVLLACGPQKPAEQKVLRFSILSTESSANQSEKWQPFLDDMAKETGLKVEPFYASNYTSLIEAMRFKQSDAGWFSNQSGMEAVRRGGGEVFAKSTHPGGKEGYNALIITKRGSGVTLDKLLACGKRYSFGMGDAKSTSGTLAPLTYLFGPRDIDPQACFSNLRSAKHEANLLSVANGLLDAATYNTNDVERMQRRHDPKADAVLEQIEVLWTSPKLPEDPIVWRKDLDPEIKAKLKSFLLGYGVGDDADAERERKILTDLNFGVFQAAGDDHLIPVREMEAAANLLEAQRKGDAAAAEAARKAMSELSARRGGAL
ncbi:phosphate/phosphite/phosphonate ABC transporter substrate-binding protein [Caulobacter segnis]|uniref:phosphate/phosphite/phosphonate ABC transporter substrate-binding protein n=1 Tax=Caulobacter segnis TaxID=88688 RepID=UPI0024106FC3|nr:phosphate/phosphite/phosphonate ABC transporter substrate-binding protein [Caulobacter segnis]MDG2523467.1 phosphate/phosphite/phosphonate ABC transporter substrate-binding protein [Caulobacter segnis]